MDLGDLVRKTAIFLIKKFCIDYMLKFWVYWDK